MRWRLSTITRQACRAVGPGGDTCQVISALDEVRWVMSQLFYRWRAVSRLRDTRGSSDCVVVTLRWRSCKRGNVFVCLQSTWLAKRQDLDSLCYHLKCRYQKYIMSWLLNIYPVAKNQFFLYRPNLHVQSVLLFFGTLSPDMGYKSKIFTNLRPGPTFIFQSIKRG